MFKMLNVINFGQTKSDNINQKITLSDDIYFVMYCEWDVEM